MSLPTSRSTTYVAGVSQVHAADLNDLQDAIVRAHASVTPPTFAAGLYNDVAIAGIDDASLIRLSTSGGSVQIQGIVAPTFEQTITLVNLGPNSVLFASEAAGSAAANRFHWPWPNAWSGTANLTLAAGNGMYGAITLRYDMTSQRWRLIAMIG